MNLEENIRRNFSKLTHNLTGLSAVLIFLIEKNIITFHEMEIIESKPTSLEKNREFFTILTKKEVSQEILATILKETKNDHLAWIFEEITQDSVQEQSTNSNVTSAESDKISKQESVLHDADLENNNVLDSTKEAFNDCGFAKCKWWPGRKNLPAYCYHRKQNGTLVSEEIRQSFKHGQIAVINGSNSGIGKTTAVIEYCYIYEKKYSFILLIDHLIFNDNIEGAFQKLSSYLTLCDSTCNLREHNFLIIYENAMKIGEEKQILTKIRNFIGKFDCIITSKSFDSSSSEYHVVHLDVFEEYESIDFLKYNLKDKELITVDDVTQLRNLLKDSPAALQIAVTTINEVKLTLKEYVSLLNSSYANINPVEKVLHLLQDHFCKCGETGNHALTIWQVFSNIRPDYVPLEFLSKVAEMSEFHFQSGINFLKKYGLVTQSKTTKISIVKHNLSFFRWIFGWFVDMRPKNYETESLDEIETLSMYFMFSKIIQTSYKPTLDITSNIIRYQSYLGYDVRKYRYKQALYLYQCVNDSTEMLKKLCQEKKLDEALYLSKEINNQQNSSSSKYNYAICLSKCSKYDKVSTILHNLLNNCDDSVKPNFNYTQDIISEDSMPDWLNVAVLLTISLYHLDKMAESKDLLDQIYEYIIESQKNRAHKNVTVIVDLLLSTTPATCQFPLITFKMQRKFKKVKLLELRDCAFDVDFMSKINADELTLTNVVFLDSHGKRVANYKISNDISSIHKRIDFNCSNVNCTHLVVFPFTFFSVSSIALDHCTLDLPDTSEMEVQAMKTNNREITLKNVIVKSRVFLKLKVFDFSQYIFFLKPKKIYLESSTANSSTRLQVSLNGLIGAENVTLINVTVILEGDNEYPKFHELHLESISFEKDDKNIEASVDISRYVDFRNIKVLSLHGNNIIVDMSADNFPRVIEEIMFEKVQVKNWHQANMTIKLFILRDTVLQKSSITVRDLQVFTSSNVTDLSVIPKSVQKLSLTSLRRFSQLKPMASLSFPDLLYLNVKCFDVEHLFKCLIAPKVKSLKLDSLHFNNENLPKTVKCLSLKNVDLLGSTTVALESLLVENFSYYKHANKVYDYLIPQKLVLLELRKDEIDKVKQWHKNCKAAKNCTFSYLEVC